MKGKSHVSNFYSYELLYSAIFENCDFQNGYKTGFSYNRTNNKGVGINTSIHLLKYGNHDIIIPSIGVSYFGFIILGYGRAIPLNDNLKSTHQIGIKLFLNKSLGLMFKMV